MVLLLLAGGVYLLPSANAGGSKKEPESVQKITNPRWVSEHNSEFAFDLYSELAEAGGNFFFSPYSISSALAMTLAGARSATAKEMEQVLHLERDGVHRAFADLRESLEARSDSGPVLSIANRLWGQSGLPWRDGFLETCREHYGAGLAEVDFMGNAEGVRRTINDWCAEQTEDKIQNLLAPGTVDPSTGLVLTNAIYFKGTWVHTFDERATRDGAFILDGGSEVQVPLMHAVEEYGYFETDTYQALEMPYSGDELSMVVFLPQKDDGLSDLEERLDARELAKAVEGFQRRKVQVTFPRFEMTSQFSLASTLEKMGMETAFGGRADFSGMAEEPLFIGAVIHKAFVEVNEEGTEAAAATAVLMTRATSVQVPPPQFVADHPFVFLIRDKETGSVLFLGRLADPRG